MKHSTENRRHTRWECKYHVVFIPKYRKRSIYGWVRRELGRSSGFSSAERERSGGGAPDGRPCLHAVVDTTEVLGLGGWWGLSRARVPLRSHEGSWIGRRTLWGRTFGRGAITCQRWGGMMAVRIFWDKTC